MEQVLPPEEPRLAGIDAEGNDEPLTPEEEAELYASMRADLWLEHDGPPLDPVGRTDAGQPVWPAGDEVCRWVRQHTDTVLVAFSLGKDSLTALWRVRQHFPRVVPFYLYLAPGLGFVDRTLAYYERALGIDIVQLPHPTVYQWLSTATLQPPERATALIGANLAEYDYDFVYTLVAEQAGVADALPWVADGIRAADSGMRRLTHTQRGPVDLRLRKFHPVHDLNTADVNRVLDALGVDLPVDYRLFGRTFDGLDHRFLAPIREHFPDDYAVLRRWYPFIELDFFRRGEPYDLPA